MSGKKATETAVPESNYACAAAADGAGAAGTVRRRLKRSSPSSPREAKDKVGSWIGCARYIWLLRVLVTTTGSGCPNNLAGLQSTMARYP